MTVSLHPDVPPFNDYHRPNFFGNKIKSRMKIFFSNVDTIQINRFYLIEINYL